MAKIRTSDLIGAQLDWAVAKANDDEIRTINFPYGNHAFVIGVSADIPFGPREKLYYPSTDWSQGGPIIERERITVGPSYEIGGEINWYSNMQVPHTVLYGRGSTPLVAAMRCYVCSRLGETVEIPDELA